MSLEGLLMLRTTNHMPVFAAPLAATGMIVAAAVGAAVPASGVGTLATPNAGSSAYQHVLSGTFANVAGRALPGLSVSVTVAGGQHAVGSSYQAPAIGRTTTGSGGSWTLRLPSPLPPAVAAAAAGNGGILNALATVDGIAADGMRLVGVEYLPVAVGGVGTAATIAALGPSVTAPAAAVYPDGQRTSTARLGAAVLAGGSTSTRASGLAAVVSAPALYQTRDGAAEAAGFHPAVVDGVDYSTAVPDDNPCSLLPKKILQSSISYTTVGETHAYAHASAAFAYHSSMSSYVSAVANFGDGPVVLSGGSMLDQHGGVGVGIAAHPAPFAYQYKVPVRYNRVRYGSHCVHGGNSYWTAVEAIGYSVPAGGKTSELGRDVISADGRVNWAKAPVKHKAVVPSGSLLTIDYQKTLTYTGAASVFGLGIQATTSYDNGHSQTYIADGSRYVHNVWGGADGFGMNVNGTSRSPKVIYSW